MNEENVTDEQPVDSQQEPSQDSLLQTPQSDQPVPTETELPVDPTATPGEVHTTSAEDLASDGDAVVEGVEESPNGA